MSCCVLLSCVVVQWCVLKRYYWAVAGDAAGAGKGWRSRGACHPIARGKGVLFVSDSFVYASRYASSYDMRMSRGACHPTA